MTIVVTPSLRWATTMVGAIRSMFRLRTCSPPDRHPASHSVRDQPADDPQRSDGSTHAAPVVVVAAQLAADGSVGARTIAYNGNFGHVGILGRDGAYRQLQDKLSH